MVKKNRSVELYEGFKEIGQNILETSNEELASRVNELEGGDYDLSDELKRKYVKGGLAVSYALAESYIEENNLNTEHTSFLENRINSLEEFLGDRSYKKEHYIALGNIYTKIAENEDIEVPNSPSQMLLQGTEDCLEDLEKIVDELSKGI